MAYDTPAIQNKIKTYFTLYCGKEEEGIVPTDCTFKPMRNSDCTLAGTTEEITSDVKVPETRIPSTPEKGSQSCAGDVSTEWNIDEQDEWFAGVFCGEWKDDEEVENKKSLTLGDVVSSFSFLKKYSQTPVDYQWFKKCYVNQVSVSMATDSFVKLTWNFMGSNNPEKVSVNPLADKTFAEALQTKSYLTTTGFLKVGDTLDTLKALRQSPSFELTINNNLERTPALFETESIENSLGDFNVTGSFDVYNADKTAQDLFNDAVNGKDKILQVRLERDVLGENGMEKVSYTLTMRVHLGAPSESKNGNKLQFQVPYTLNSKDDLSLEKEVTTI